MSDIQLIHERAKDALTRDKRRYTNQRRRIVELLVGAGRPVTLPELLAADPGMSQSSAYRTLDVLERANLVLRLTGAGHARFEPSEALVAHHHHLICDSCGLMTDVQLDEDFERSIDQAFHQAAADSGFSPERHSIDLHGRCANCHTD